MRLSDEDLKRLQGDSVSPDGSIDIRKLEFRKTEEHEVYQCTARVGNDPQSGFLYCGRAADIVGFHKDNEGIYVALLCESCQRKYRDFIKFRE